MARLPRDIVKKYGISKKAWAVFRSRHGGGRRGRHNRAHRRMPPRTASGRFRKRRGRHNRTGYPFSGKHYRPNYRRTGRGRRFADRRPKARGLPHFIRGRHNPRRRRSGRHRRGRRNPAFGYAGGRRHGLGSIRSAIPLLRSGDWHMMWDHKLGSLVFIGAGYFINGVVAASGGSLAVIVSVLIEGVIIRYALRRYHGGKYSYVAPAWVLGGLLAAVSNIVSSGSLTGSARLGDTLANLQALAAQVRAYGIQAPAAWSLKGLSGTTSLNAALRMPRLNLRGLGDIGVGADLRKLSPSHLTGLGDTSPQGWSYSA